MGASPEPAPSTLGQPVVDVEDDDPDDMLLWTDTGDTWWEQAAGAPSDREARP